MADETPGGRPPRYEPLPGWPGRPEGGAEGTEGGGPEPAARAPSEPLAGWPEARPPWVEPAGSGGRDRWPMSPPVAPSPRHTPGRLAGVGGRRNLVIGAVVLLLVVAGGLAAILLTSGDDSPKAAGSGGVGGHGRSTKAPAAAAGSEIKLLDGRLVVTALPGWEQREASADTATLKLELRAPGRELLATLVVAAISGGGSLDGTLAVDGGTRFEVSAPGGSIQATAVPSTGNVRAVAVRPSGSLLLSLSVFAMDGNPLDLPTLRNLFTEQVAPQLSFP